MFTQDRVKGAIRTWFHYPVSVKGYVLSKTFNTLLFTALVSLPIYAVAFLIAVSLDINRAGVMAAVTVTLLVLIGLGYHFLKDLYPDMFISETA